jgi:hypothetical protein
MSYRITITRIETVMKKLGQEWRVTGEEPMYPGSPEQAAIKKQTWGYTPEIEKETAEETEVLKQTVQNIDLAAVIKAINNL